MGIRYEIVGYNKHNDKLAVTYEIPLKYQAVVKALVIDEKDDGMGEYPLSTSEVASISLIIGNKEINPINFIYHLSPFFVG